MIPGLNETSDKPVTRFVSKGGVLLNAFVIFAMLNLFLSGIIDYETVFKWPRILLIAGVNYIPLILVPIILWRSKNSTGLGFLGLDFVNFKKTFLISIFAFIIAGASQPGLLLTRDIVQSPNWDIYLLIITIPVLAIVVPFVDMIICHGINIPAGLITLAVWGIHGFFFPLGDESMSKAMSQATVSSFDIIVLAALLGIYVPFVEEFFFRGFVLKYFFDRFGSRPFIAIFITSMLFGFAHFGIPGVPSLALFAIPLGMLVYFCDSIYPAIFAHAGLNLAGVAVVWLSNNST